MSEWDRIGRTRELLRRCSEEIGDAARAAVLTSEFTRVLDSSAAIALLDDGQFCRAFALAASQRAFEEPDRWLYEDLIRLADMCFHNGDSEEGERLLALANRQGQRR